MMINEIPKSVKDWLKVFEEDTFDKVVDGLHLKFLELDENDQYLIFVNLWWELCKRGRQEELRNK